MRRVEDMAGPRSTVCIVVTNSIGAVVAEVVGNWSRTRGLTLGLADGSGTYGRYATVNAGGGGYDKLGHCLGCLRIAAVDQSAPPTSDYHGWRREVEAAGYRVHRIL